MAATERGYAEATYADGPAEVPAPDIDVLLRRYREAREAYNHHCKQLTEALRIGVQRLEARNQALMSEIKRLEMDDLDRLASEEVLGLTPKSIDNYRT
jgi:uncharacterized small protein (DUF1192 family)